MSRNRKTSQSQSQNPQEVSQMADQKDVNQQEGWSDELEAGPSLEDLMEDVPDDLAGREPPETEILPPEPRKPDPVIAAQLGPLLGGILDIPYNRIGAEPTTPTEQQALGIAGANLVAQYDLGAVDPKTAAWIGLGMVVVGLSVPRVMEVQERRRQEDKRQHQDEPEASMPDSEAILTRGAI